MRQPCQSAGSEACNVLHEKELRVCHRLPGKLGLAGRSAKSVHIIYRHEEVSGQRFAHPPKVVRSNLLSTPMPAKRLHRNVHLSPSFNDVKKKQRQNNQLDRSAYQARYRRGHRPSSRPNGLRPAGLLPLFPTRCVYAYSQYSWERDMRVVKRKTKKRE